MDPLSNNSQNMNLFDWDFDETFQKLSELPPLESLLEFDSFDSCNFEGMKRESESSFLLPLESDASNYWTNYDHQQMLMISDGLVSDNGGVNSEKEEEKEGIRVRSGRKRTIQLELEEIQKHFHLPITKAAKEMKVGLTVLKKQCREFNIMRWPHRKIKSLKTLIHNLKEMGVEGEIEMVEQHKRMVEKVPDAQLSLRTKKLRQACFKANYKKKRCLIN